MLATPKLESVRAHTHGGERIRAKLPDIYIMPEMSMQASKEKSAEWSNEATCALISVWRKRAWFNLSSRFT